VSKSGLPDNIKTRHDLHYIEELSRPNKTVGKIIQIDLVEPNPDQPRREFGDLTDLTNSIKEHGVLEPLLVRPIKDTNRWMIIAGERRWRSAKGAGLKEVPCIELDLTDEAVAEIALVENLQRKDLTIWEEADGIAQLAAKYAYTHEKISQVIGKGRTTITEYMAIAGMPADVRDKCLKVTSPPNRPFLRLHGSLTMRRCINSWIRSSKVVPSHVTQPVRKLKHPRVRESHRVRIPASPRSHSRNNLSLLLERRDTITKPMMDPSTSK